MTEWLVAVWFPFSASLAGALWGVSLQSDFSSISIRSKAWRCCLAVALALCIGPGVIHTYFARVDPKVSTAIMFVISLASLTVVPIVLRRVQLLAKTGRLWGLPEDKQ